MPATKQPKAPAAKLAASGARKATTVAYAKPAARAVRSAKTGMFVAKKFDDLVHSKPVMGTAAVEIIRHGYPAAIMKSASSFLGVPEARIHRIMHVSSTTANRLLKQNSPVDAAATERVLRISDVTRMAIDVFEDEDAAKDWLRQPNESLGDAAPLDLLDTEPGAVTVRQVLNAIATGAPL